MVVKNGDESHDTIRKKSPEKQIQNQCQPHNTALEVKDY